MLVFLSFSSTADRDAGLRFSLTLERKLLHLDLIELVGADDGAVVGQVDTAAGLKGLDLLGNHTRNQDQRETRYTSFTGLDPVKFQLELALFDRGGDSLQGDAIKSQLRWM